MSEELQKEIDRLKADLAKTTTDLEAAKAGKKDVSTEARDRRLKSKALQEQLDALKAERAAEKAAAATEKATVKAELEKRDAILRGMKHDNAFARVADTLKVKDPGKRADLYRLSEYKSDAFDPDESKIADSFKAVLKGRPWLLDESPEETARAAKSAARAANGAEWARSDLKPGPGSERGGSVQSESKSTPPGRIPGRL